MTTGLSLYNATCAVPLVDACSRASFSAGVTSILIIAPPSRIGLGRDPDVAAATFLAIYVPVHFPRSPLVVAYLYFIIFRACLAVCTRDQMIRRCRNLRRRCPRCDACYSKATKIREHLWTLYLGR